jgi:hypothetical protein
MHPCRGPCAFGDIAWIDASRLTQSVLPAGAGLRAGACFGICAAARVADEQNA